MAGDDTTPDSPGSADGDDWYHITFDDASTIPTAPDDRPASGWVVRGERLRVGKRRIPAGTAAEAHTHATEQFTLIERGRLRSRIAGEEATVGEHHLLYVPAGADHDLEVLGAEDAVVFFVTPRPDVGVDRDAALTDDIEKPVLTPGEPYHFDLKALDRRLAARGLGSSIGCYVVGEAVQVGSLRYAPGDGPGFHSHPNEMFNLGLADGGRWTVDGTAFTLDAGEVAHVPPNATHALEAPPDREWHWFAAKDTSFRMYGKSPEG